MRFLIDANLPYSLRDVLVKHGQAWHVRDLRLEAANDTLVLRAAVKKRATLVTRDLEFGNPYLYPPAQHYGVIIVRVPSFYQSTEIADVLTVGITRLATVRLTHVVAVVEPGRLRIRRLKLP